MRIKIGDMGTRVAPVSDRARVGPASFVVDDGGVAENSRRQSVNALVQDREQTAHDQRQQVKEQQHHDLQMDLARQREQFQAEQQAKRNIGASAFASYQVELDELVAATGQRLTSGQIKRDDAQAELDKALVELKKKHLEPLDREVRSTLEDNLILFDGKAKSHFGKVIQQHAKAEGVAAVTTGMEALQRLAVKDPGGATRQASMLLDANVGLFGADEVAKQKAKFSENAYATHFMERLTGARSNYGALSNLEKDVAGNAVLDPDKKNIIMGRIKGFQEHIAAAGERAERSRLANVQAQIGAVDSMILRGFEPTAQQMVALSQIAKGTPYEPVVKAQVEFANQTAEFRAMPPMRQQTFINGFERDVRANPTPDGLKTLDSLKKIYTAQTEAVRQDPISFAEQKGLAPVYSLDLAAALRNPGSLKDQFNSRLTVARGMKDQYGSPLLVLKKEEAEMVPKLFEGMNPPQKAEALKAIGNLIGDPVAMRDLAIQIESKDKGLSTAMFLAAQDRRTVKGRNLAELYLIGQDALQTKSAKIDDKAETGLRADITQRLEGVYATTTARDMAVDVAMKVWASGRVSSNGLDSVSRATDIATGGIMDLNGGKVAKPYGWTDGRFRDGLSSITPEAITTQSGGADKFMVGKDVVTAAQLAKTLPSARLQTVGDGRYAVISGPDYVRLPDRKPLIIELR